MFESDFEPDGTLHRDLTIEWRYGVEQGQEWYSRYLARLEYEPIALGTWEVAAWLEAQGNKGFTIREIDRAGLPTWFLNRDHKYKLEGVIFINSEGDVFCRKNPQNWKLAWADKYRNMHRYFLPIWEKIDQVDAEIAAAEAEAQKPKRIHTNFSLGRLEDFSTVHLAYHMAVLDVMVQRCTYRRLRQLQNFDDNYIAMLNNLYVRERLIISDELNYRLDAEPEPRSSQKKTREAKADWAKTPELLAGGTRYFFSQEFITQAVEDVEEPDLRVDFEHLPKLPMAKMVVRWQRDYEVVQSFFRWLDEEHEEGSFEWEDRQMMIANLRKMYARIKGQTLEDVAVMVGEGT